MQYFLLLVNDLCTLHAWTKSRFFKVVRTWHISADNLDKIVAIFGCDAERHGEDYT
jgi:hypothetical protein